MHGSFRRKPNRRTSRCGASTDTAQGSHRRPTLARSSTPTITTKDGTELYYKDWGAGQPIVFSDGWPLISDACEDQTMFLAAHGYRCVAHDRRGLILDAKHAVR
jgi:hypothetical protein